MKLITTSILILAIAACAGTPHPPTTSRLPTSRRATLHTDSSIAAHAAYSRSGRHVAIAGHSKEVRVWDVATAALVAKLPEAGETVIAGPDEDTFIVLDGSLPRVTVWNWRTSAQRTISILDALASFAPTAGIHGASSVSQIALSPDGTTLLTVHDQAQGIVAWDVASGTPKQFVAGEVSTVAFLPDSARVVTVGKQLAVYDFATGARTVLHEADVPYDDVVISADGTRLVAARGFGERSSGPSSLDVLALPQGTLVRTIQVEATRWQVAHANMALTADGTKLLVTVARPTTGRNASEAVLFDLATGTAQRTFSEVLSTLRDDPTTLASSLAIAPDGASLVVGYRDIALF